MAFNRAQDLRFVNCAPVSCAPCNNTIPVLQLYFAKNEAVRQVSINGGFACAPAPPRMPVHPFYISPFPLFFL